MQNNNNQKSSTAKKLQQKIENLKKYQRQETLQS